MSSPEPPQDGDQGGGHGHWMMVACCVPMIVVAVALVAAGVVSVGLLAIALGCLVMMGAMMMAMRGGH